ncbi:AEC family transporter [Lacihabitans soyangensis]|uniref:AEC family transporter n=1 Tax=Lacihabitans soyangensis TaxID=869394 RepID=A0AAE3H990_9BACT|nr:AEC family transporter [Lacihabitans soyangensis]MCP9765960.1 AEC family transporter [Lacihabitans soyangensis]
MAQANATFIITLALILMGFLIKKYNFISEKEGKVLSKFLMHTTFPALMIISTSKVKLEPSLFLLPILCVAMGIIMISVAFYLFKDLETKLRGVLTMGAGGLNVGLFGFPLIEGIWGTEALVFAVMFDIGNTIMTFGGVYPVGSYFAQRGDGKFPISKLLLRVFTLPPVTGMVIGLSINIFSIPLPDIAFDFLGILAKANKPLVLLLMGIYLSFELNKAQMKYMSQILFLRYLIGGICVAGIYFLVPPSLMQSVLIVLVILPLGMTILPFSDEFGFDSRIAGTMVNISLLISFVLIWLLVWLLHLV